MHITPTHIPRPPLRKRPRDERGGRTTSHFGDGVSFHWAISAAFFKRQISDRSSHGTYSPTRIWTKKGLNQSVLQTIRYHQVQTKLEERGFHYENELRSGLPLLQLTASAALFKMAAWLTFIFCWSTSNFHCLNTSSSCDPHRSKQVCSIRYSLSPSAVFCPSTPIFVLIY